MKITENITATLKMHGIYTVTDRMNKVSVNIPSWIVDECDTDDQQSVEKALERIRAEYAKRDEPRYNICVDVEGNEKYWYGDDWNVDPLSYCDAFYAEDIEREKKSIADSADCEYLYTEEVKPFIF